MRAEENEDVMLDVSDIPEEMLLAALYNASQPLGMGFLQATPGDMTEQQAHEHIVREREYQTSPLAQEQGIWFDYLIGRVMKIRINGKTLDPRLYDRDNGFGAARRVVGRLLKQIAAESPA